MKLLYSISLAALLGACAAEEVHEGQESISSPPPGQVPTGTEGQIPKVPVPNQETPNNLANENGGGGPWPWGPPDWPAPWGTPKGPPGNGPSWPPRAPPGPPPNEWRPPNLGGPPRNPQQGGRRPNEQQWTVGRAVDTSSGRVTGHPAAKRPLVSEYLGIPFAQPPVGRLRFGAPRKYESDEDISGAAFGYDCPANVPTAASLIPIAPELIEPQAIELFSQLGQVGNNQSEDCLTLNVWTKPQMGAKKKAVLFWIFGGGFQFGTTHLTEYNGQYFANDQDVVVVSANYRTNIFGFPGLPGLWGTPQNPGLLDQRLAIEWVRDNIEAFGGDPDRITIFGRVSESDFCNISDKDSESAGAASVDVYAFAYYNKDPIVNGFISESGTNQAFANPWPNDHISDWYNMSSQVGCGGPSTPLERSLRCVRTKPFQDILAVTRIANPLQALLGVYTPTVDHEIVFSDYTLRGDLGQFIRKPYFIGNNFNEAGLFKLLAQAGGENISDTQWALFNQAIFQCPTATSAGYRIKHLVPTYRYLYFGDFQNLKLTNSSGAYHTSEIPVVWQTIGDVVTPPSTEPELKLSKYMNTVWASFAKDPPNGLTLEPWFDFPRYNPFLPSLLLFGASPKAHPFVAPPTLFDALCPILDLIGDLIPGGLPALVLAGETGTETESLATVKGAKAKKSKKLGSPTGSSINYGTGLLSKDPRIDQARLQKYTAQLRGLLDVLEGTLPVPSHNIDLPPTPHLDTGSYRI